MTPPTASPPRGTPRLDPGRLRAWLAAAVAVLLVLVYLSVEWTYASAHLPPNRFDPVAPGGTGRSRDADFRLVSLRRTDQWGLDDDGNPASPEPGAVWVVAELQVTPRRDPQLLLCTSSLVATDGRSWKAEDLPPEQKGAPCPSDTDDVQVGRTYSFVEGFQVPENEADHLAGIGIETFSWRAEPLLRP